MPECKNPDAEPTSSQTFGLFKLTRKDCREEVTRREINRQQFSELMGKVYKVAKDSGWDNKAANAEAEKLFSEFPLRS